jgi:hypothetical protein
MSSVEIVYGYFLNMFGALDMVFLEFLETFPSEYSNYFRSFF